MYPLQQKLIGFSTENKRENEIEKKVKEIKYNSF